MRFDWRVAQPTILRVPLDKREGVVKRNFSWAVRRAPLFRRPEVWTQLRTNTGKNLAIDHYSMEPVSFHQPSIRPTTSTMILLCEHPAARSRCESGKRFYRFPSAQRVFCTGGSGCESAQSIQRPILVDGQGHPRAALDSERSPDTAFACAASSRVARPSVSPPLLWQCLSACCDSGERDVCEILHPDELALCAASTSSMRRKPLPCLVMAPSRCRPPELCSRGIRPT